MLSEGHRAALCAKNYISGSELFAKACAMDSRSLTVVFGYGSCRDERWRGDRAPEGDPARPRECERKF